MVRVMRLASFPGDCDNRQDERAIAFEAIARKGEIVTVAQFSLPSWG
jgi:hypothetical protein